MARKSFYQDIDSALNDLDREYNTGKGIRFTINFNSKPFRKLMKRLSDKLSDMTPIMELIGAKLTENFYNHFINNEGPDEDGNMISWPPYNINPTAPLKSYIYRKRRLGGDDKLLLMYGPLMESLTPGGDGNVFEVTDNSVTVGTDIGYYMFHHFGFRGKNGSPTEEETKRPIVGISNDEEDELVEFMTRELFDNIDDDLGD
jgi:phage gpG-like protein